MQQRVGNALRRIKAIPGIRTLLKTTAWKLVRYKITLLTCQRRTETFTRFQRIPTQLEALSGPVVDFLLEAQPGKALRAIVLGCSTGAEPYSIASTLRNAHSHLKVAVSAYDINGEIIKRARQARYERSEVVVDELITSEFINSTFDQQDDVYVVKDDIREVVSFDVADVLHPQISILIGKADLVFAQNVLIHMKKRDAIRGLQNIYSVLNPRAALFISGTDMNSLVKFTRRNDLVPCEYKIKEIYNEAASYSRGWPYSYQGFEPFMTVRRGWKRRYSTIFFKT